MTKTHHLIARSHIYQLTASVDDTTHHQDYFSDWQQEMRHYEMSQFDDTITYQRRGMKMTDDYHHFTVDLGDYSLSLLLMRGHVIPQ